ncbi:Vps75p KNAG_0F00690 [Huiozyma naganishii CBS 8797]|uniref:Vacuolar protein sorting-associated protein 75 n=1 Tax=Huiozyma naganishii (strain ATCC MYA-139 / BCRC 22969 / CBS 8797 / KCTC 17520 / NBRC 10181 / NCYC 3082 / Yp74L-3) TaxID=1071383 RepID=J7RMF8_HUIN7|nr:hypothetical protein KNAG_0F00690 [Kazachstania naganishii CBS 8797]CCK70738.1 hypothetical protein KNAG_0F00690 [Kazachstania naganishii CBS 8797]
MSDKKQIADALRGLADNESAMDVVEKQVEKYRLDLLRPVYKDRDELIGRVPSFWMVVLSQHSNFANFIRASDFKYVDCIDDVRVEWDEANPGNFSVNIKFHGLEGDFPAQSVTKRFRLVKVKDDMKVSGNDEDRESGDDDDEEEYERLLSDPVDVEWPVAYDSINPDKIQDKRASKKEYRTGMKTLFGWFRWTGLKPGKEFPNGESLAELFANDLYPYCVKYYIEAQRDLADEMSDSDNDDSAEEPLELPSDDDEVQDHSKKRRLE